MDYIEEAKEFYEEAVEASERGYRANDRILLKNLCNLVVIKGVGP